MAPPWRTTPTPGTGGRRAIYFAADGDNGNSGLSPSEPKLTPSAAFALMRQGVGDQVFARRGDTFSGGWGTTNLALGGEDSDFPWVVGAYGNPALPRPIFQTGDNNWLNKFGLNPIEHMVIRDLDFDCAGRDDSAGPTAIGVNSPSNDLTIEGCRGPRYSAFATIQGDTGNALNLVIRGNVFFRTYDLVSHAQGIYLSKALTALIEWNYFILCGHNDEIPGDAPDTLKHGLYGATSSYGTITRKNFFYWPSSHGEQKRGGGDSEDNTFVRCPIGLLLGTGGADGGGDDPTQPIYGNSSHNVHNDGQNIPGFGGRGWAKQRLFLSGGTSDHDLIIHNTTGESPIPSSFDGTQGDGNHNITTTNEICYEWGGSYQFSGDSTKLSNIAFNGIDITNTIDSSPLLYVFDATTDDQFTFDNLRVWPGGAGQSQYRNGATTSNFATWLDNFTNSNCSEGVLTYADATRTVSTYATVHGYSDLDDMLADMMEQERERWLDVLSPPDINTWVRAGYFPVVPVSRIPRQCRVGAIVLSEAV